MSVLFISLSEHDAIRDRVISDNISFVILLNFSPSFLFLSSFNYMITQVTHKIN